MNDIFADVIRRENQLYEELASCPIVELTGLVNPDGVTAAQNKGQTLWSLLLTLDAWRVEGEPTRIEELTLRRQVTDEELAQFQEQIEEETAIRIRGRVSEKNIFGNPQGLLEEFIESGVDDSELNECLAELKKPFTYQDERFGTLTYDRQMSWYSADVTWSRKTVELNIHVDKAEEIDASLRIANGLWDNEPSWHDRIQEYAVQKLLPLKNESWLDDDETEISPAEFKAKMTLESISVSADGKFEFWHNDGNLFLGHSIQISGNLSEGLTDADIPG